jgi:hypothetical protein
MYDEVVYLLASVPPGSAVDGITSFRVFHHDGRGISEEPHPTTGLVQESIDNWAIVVHDLKGS